VVIDGSFQNGGLEKFSMISVSEPGLLASALATMRMLLKNDKCAIFTAARHAGEAYDLIVGTT
jgi:hypothetical protein